MIALARQVVDVLLAALWQDACIALSVGAVLALSGRRLNATTRFAALHALLFTLIAVPLLTTLPRASAQDATRMLVFATSPESGRLPDLARASAPRVVDVASSDALVAGVTVLWLLVLAAFVLRYAVSAHRLSRLLRRSTLVTRRGGVRVFASPDVPVPLAYGFARPSIVVPADVAARAGEELECILLHELAHVRRRDAWTNAYERVVHAALFGNPAVGLVLRAIALEREAACDDWAVARSRDADAYARSLAAFALRRHQRMPALCGASGFGSATMARLRRLDDAHRNGAPTLAHAVLGGFTAVLAAIALSIATFAPTLALASDRIVLTSAQYGRCPKPVQGMSPLPTSLPAGLRSAVDVRLSRAGMELTTVRSSGNARFDRIARTGARQLVRSIGKVSVKPAFCGALSPGLYHVSAETRGLDVKRHVREALWVVKFDRTRAPVVVPAGARG